MNSESLTQWIAGLGVRVNGHPENVDEVVPQLVALLDEYEDPQVIAEIIDALGCSWDERANLAAVPYADHPDPRVRNAVAHAIPCGVDSAAGQQLVADALIRLSRDDLDEIRDWATFGLGTQMSIDDDEVRAALFARLSDSNEDVRDEALVGLAQRRDRRVVEFVAQALAEDKVGPLVFEAAEFLADPTLHESLAEWHAVAPDDERVSRATRACDRDYQRSRTQQYASLLAAVERRARERGLGVSVAMYCRRDSVEVLLKGRNPRLVSSVDGYLERARGDIDQAADEVIAYETAEP